MKEEIKKFIQSKWNSGDSERFPGPQPISIEKKHIPFLSEKDYMVCEKTDGVRHFLVCFTDSLNRKICALVNRSFDYVLYPLTVPRDTLLDGELINDNFIVHDAVCIQGEDLRQKTLVERLEKVRLLVKIIIPTKIRVTCKKMIPYKNMSQLVLSDNNDGVIFTPVHEPIRMGTHWTMFKWKPFEKITIDFLVRDGGFYIQADNQLLQIQKTDQKENGIFECYYDGKKWVSIKQRTDKNHPNNKRTFQRTLVNIKENIKFCELVPTR